MAKKQSFWTTVPGILTGLAAVITAVGGLLVVLSQTGLLGGPAGAPEEASGAGGRPGPVESGDGSTTGGQQAEGAREAFTSEREPNDDIASATPIATGASVQAYLTEGDVDVFTFSTGEGFRNVFEIRVTNAGTFAPDVYLYDDLKNQIENEYSITQGADAVIELSAQPGSAYYVSVKDVDGFEGRLGDYRLSVQPR
jgi:hypothetical protein